MKQIQIGIAFIGAVLAILGYFDNKSNMSKTIAHLSRVVVRLQKAEDARIFDAKVDSAVAAQVREVSGGEKSLRGSRRPTRSDIAREITKGDSLRKIAAPVGEKQFQRDIEQVRKYAKPRTTK